MAYVSPNWERIRCSSMRSLIQNTRKMRTKAMNPRTWEMAIAMPRNRPECRCRWGDGPRLGTGGNQLVPLLIGDGAASVSAEVLTRPDRDEEKAGSVLTTGAGRRLCGCAEIRGICDIKEIGSSIQDGRGDCCQATQQRGRCGRGFGRKSP